MSLSRGNDVLMPGRADKWRALNEIEINAKIIKEINRSLREAPIGISWNGADLTTLCR
jgi:hypothetical protein